MHLRFFLSSPGDVADERIFAQQVIEQELPKDPLLRGEITCEAIRWDDPAAPVSMPEAVRVRRGHRHPVVPSRPPVTAEHCPSGWLALPVRHGMGI